MGFGAPWGFLWFLGWGVVLLIHFLQRRLRRVDVSALFLWERIPETPLSFRERLRALWDILLFLQLLSVGILAVAFAEPLLERRVPTGSVALVLDGSASMGAAGRPKAVREIASGIVRDSAGPWEVVLWADPPRYLVPPTGDRAEALQGISRYAPTYGRRSPLGEALAYLRGPWDRVVIVTDSPPPESQGLEVVVLPPVEDLGITAFSLRPSPQGSGFEAYVSVWNGGTTPKDVPVTIRVGEYSFRERIAVPPGKEKGLAFPYFGPIDRGFVAAIEAGDPFPWDDVRYFSLGPGRILRVRWVGEDDRFLRAAIRASGPALFVDSPPWDLTVAVRTEIGEVEGPTLLWESAAPGIGLGEPQGEGGWVAEDDLLAGLLDLSRWGHVEAFSVAAPEGSRVLLRRGTAPAVFTLEGPKGKVAAVALSFAAAQEVLISPDFPLFVHFLLSLLIPPSPRGTYEVGDAVVLPPGAAAILEGGERSGGFVPEAPGLYRVRSGDGSVWELAVNIPREEIVPPVEMGEPSQTHVFRSGEAEAKHPLWRFWAWALLGVLLLEGALALRRW